MQIALVHLECDAVSTYNAIGIKQINLSQYKWVMQYANILVYELYWCHLEI